MRDWMSRPGVRKKMVVCEEGEPLIPATLSDRVTQLIGVVRPSKSSEERRNRVAKYVRKLIADCFAPEHKVGGVLSKLAVEPEVVGDGCHCGIGTCKVYSAILVGF